MPHWLYEQIRAADLERSPQFALQSTLNWMKALSFEIVGEHGPTPQNQFDSCRQFFIQRFQPSRVQRDLGDVFEALFQSLTHAMALATLVAGATGAQPWLYPGAIVWWYYGYYTAVHAMLHTHGHGAATDTHGSTIRAFDGMVRTNMPHPLDMVATLQQAETYTSSLPRHPAATPASLQMAFGETRAESQGMLLEYLSGTARYEVNAVKTRLLAEQHGFADFRTNAARELRNRRLQNHLAHVSFMHCAFRYRGKANYRDAIYITYGQRTVPADTFLANLACSVIFAFVCGLAYVERRVGSPAVRAFLQDLHTNTRGLSSAAPSAQFWTQLSV